MVWGGFGKCVAGCGAGCGALHNTVAQLLVFGALWRFDALMCKLALASAGSRGPEEKLNRMLV